MRTYAILHNLRSVANVGSIFRTADGAGVSKIFLTGYTPAPIDRFGRVRPKMKKTSLGATELVEWEQVLIISDLMERLKNDGVSVVAVEQHERSIDYRNFEQTRDSAYLFGNEVDGVSGPLCNEADAVLEIPMVGTKESLNVSVVAGIILYNARKARS